MIGSHSRGATQHASCLLALSFAVLSVSLPASRAFGDYGHGAPAPQRAHTDSAADTSLLLNTSTTAFSEGVLTGMYLTLAPRGEFWWRSFAVSLRVPMHTLSMTGAERETGIGDASLGASHRWHPSFGVHRIDVDLGLELLLPTGDSELGLGQGTVALSPRILGSMSLTPTLQLYGALSAVANTSSTADSNLFVEQRSDVEARFALGGGWNGPRVRLGVTSQLTLPVAPGGARGALFLVAGPSAELRATRRLFVTAFAMVPLTADRQYDWSAGVALGYRMAATGTEQAEATEHSEEPAEHTHSEAHEHHHG